MVVAGAVVVEAVGKWATARFLQLSACPQPRLTSIHPRSRILAKVAPPGHSCQEPLAPH